MHWWQGAFASSSKPHSEDDSMVRYNGLFSSRRNRHLQRARKLRHISENDVDMWRSPCRYENSPARSSSASPQPLPLPELHVLLRHDPKFANGSVPLPSPKDAIQIPRDRGGFEERERETINEDPDDDLNGLKRLAGQDKRTNTQQSEPWSSRKSGQKQNANDRSTDIYNINIPISAPTSPYASPILSPPTIDTFSAHSMTPPGVFQVWSAPEMPHSDENLGSGFHYQLPCEGTASSVDNSPLQSPRLSSHVRAASPPRPASPLNSKISSETQMGRRESSAQATVHPLPLPPGATMSPLSLVTDFSGASMPSQTSPLSSHPAPKLEFSGANISSQAAPISPVARKPQVRPIKSQWQKGKLIGRGTFGSVYVASNRRTGALCAMKEVEILPDDSKSAESIRQLEQEIKVLRHLKHPNIVQYYGSEIVGDKFYIYLEYVHPGSINRFIHDHCGAITESVVRNFTRHILCGLAYLHSKKTIHRDIKGANLLVDAYGVVKLADFGMAKHLNGQTANLSLKGSPYWLAPELLQSVMPKDASSDIALAVDIWSLGCTIIEMMNGKPPWSEYEGAAALFKVLQETPPIPDTLSADGKDFLQCCFRRNPADRPTAIKLLDHPFVNYSQQPESCTLSLDETRLSDNMRFVRERQNHNKFDQVPTSFDTQIKKGKLSNNFMHNSFSPVRLANEVITKHPG
ncbi:hypothetical protein ACJIZ3_014862 [Penstemon smallii]|uniref:mitogen-activated protein kinase kinase kinase n=1 Tax=Penstemon smallii TaxID=265156 RepID=A0ABD3RKT8_9LAMI